MSEPTVGHTAASEAAAQPATFDAAVDAACARIAPAWPLDRLIAVNPYWGFYGHHHHHHHGAFHCHYKKVKVWNKHHTKKIWVTKKTYCHSYWH